MIHIKSFNESIEEDKYEWQKNFEILSFKYSFFDDDFRIIDKSHPEYDDCVKDCVDASYRKDIVSINSVKRIKDGEVFTLGDYVENKEIKNLNLNIFLDECIGPITKIWPSLDQMRIDIDKLGMVLNNLDVVKVDKSKRVVMSGK